MTVIITHVPFVFFTTHLGLKTYSATRSVIDTSWFLLQRNVLGNRMERFRKHRRKPYRRNANSYTRFPSNNSLSNAPTPTAAHDVPHDVPHDSDVAPGPTEPEHARDTERVRGRGEHRRASRARARGACAGRQPGRRTTRRCADTQTFEGARARQQGIGPGCCAAGAALAL